MEIKRMLLLLLIYASAAFPSHLIVFRGESDKFSEVVESMRSELESEFTIVEHVIRDVNPQLVINAMKSEPEIVVLMENNSINSYIQYQRTTGDTLTPSVCLMAANVGNLIQHVKNSTAIDYEVSILTTLMVLRNNNLSYVDKIGVIYRSNFGGFVEQNRKTLEQEGVELVAIEINDNNISGSIQRELRNLHRMGVDALWIPNDNVLLNSSTISAWQSFTRTAPYPVIVGVENLLRTNFRIGDIGNVPDHEELGIQAASIVWEIFDNEFVVPEWLLGQTAIPFTIESSYNPDRLRRFFERRGVFTRNGITRDDVLNFDKIVK
ncbi:hypothetical protein CHISP_3281 [Chitinispirillum alkaliphilum]|nr:hypothetical protein CHISP_3281 [Chitinispirillum alkaliphilum]